MQRARPQHVRGPVEADAQDLQRAARADALDAQAGGRVGRTAQDQQRRHRVDVAAVGVVDVERVEAAGAHARRAVDLRDDVRAHASLDLDDVIVDHRGAARRDGAQIVEPDGRAAEVECRVREAAVFQDHPARLARRRPVRSDQLEYGGVGEAGTADLQRG